MRAAKPFWFGLLGSVVGFMVMAGMSFFWQDVFTVDRSGTIDLRVSNAGNVGIGMQGAVESPGSRLVVKGATTTSAASALDVQASDGTSRLFVRDDGNVGIGTTGPLAPVHVVYSGDRVARFDSIAPFLEFTETDQSNKKWYLVFDGTNFEIRENDLITSRLVMRAGGLVGIGRTPTANVLEVEGNASKTTAGGWLANSDARIKIDIRNLERPLDTINNLRPVKFRYTEVYRMKHPSIQDQDYVNFIAQEFQRVFPDSVQDDGTGLLQIDTHNVTPYLVAAVQELARKIEKLETENRSLKDRLEARR